MRNSQLYLAMGVPTFCIPIGDFQPNHVLNQINLRFTSLEIRTNSLKNRLDPRMSSIENDIKTIVRITGDLYARIVRLEERIAR